MSSVTNEPLLPDASSCLYSYFAEVSVVENLFRLLSKCRFEQNSMLGGRAHSIEIEGHTVELGASIVYQGNHYIAQLVDAVNLPRIQPGSSEDGGLLGIFDGQIIKFQTYNWKILNLLSMIWHYGFTFWTYSSHTKTMLGNYEAIYRLQDAGEGYERPEDLLKAVDLYELTQQSMLEWISNTIVTGYDRFASEFVAAVSRGRLLVSHSFYVKIIPKQQFTSQVYMCCSEL